MLKWKKSFLLIAFSLAAFGAAFPQKYDTLPGQPEYYKKLVARFQSQAVKPGCTVFLGNSITEGGKWDILLNDTSVVNRGIAGDNTFGVLKRLDEITRHKPSKVYLMIGINDLSKNIPNAKVIENIFSIVSRIRAESPTTRLYVQSILPVNPKNKKFPPSYAQLGNIMDINNQLKKYGAALKYTYVDLYSHFLGNDMLLEMKYTEDGLHLNSHGYHHWVEYLRKNKLL